MGHHKILLPIVQEVKVGKSFIASLHLNSSLGLEQYPTFIREILLQKECDKALGNTITQSNYAFRYEAQLAEINNMFITVEVDLDSYRGIDIDNIYAPYRIVYHLKNTIDLTQNEISNDSPKYFAYIDSKTIVDELAESNKEHKAFTETLDPEDIDWDINNEQLLDQLPDQQTLKQSIVEGWNYYITVEGIFYPRLEKATGILVDNKLVDRWTLQLLGTEITLTRLYRIHSDNLLG